MKRNDIIVLEDNRVRSDHLSIDMHRVIELEWYEHQCCAIVFDPTNVSRQYRIVNLRITVATQTDGIPSINKEGAAFFNMR